MSNYVALRELLYNYDFGSLFNKTLDDMDKYLIASRLYPAYLELNYNEIDSSALTSNSYYLDILSKILVIDLFEFGEPDTIFEVACILLSQFNSVYTLDDDDKLFARVLNGLENHTDFNGNYITEERLSKLIEAYRNAISNGVSFWYKNGAREVVLEYFDCEAAIQNEDTAKDVLLEILQRIESKPLHKISNFELYKEYTNAFEYAIARVSAKED